MQFSGSHSDSDSLRKNGKLISSDGMDDSGMGSASDSGQKTGNSDSEPETISEKTAQAAVGLTYEQILQNSKTKRPKRNGSSLSRFSNIFKSDGKKLADSLTEELYLNDRFSGTNFIIQKLSSQIIFFYNIILPQKLNFI